jgi:sec-independent protein translocase protein TatA
MAPLALIGSFGMQEMLVILLILIVLFGARRIPELARGLGEGIRGFRSSLRGDDDTSGNDKDAGDVTKTSNS